PRPLIPGATPGNPFARDVQVVLIDPGMDRPELTNHPSTRTWTASSTLYGQIGQWSGFFDLSHTRNTNSYMNNAFVEPAGGWNAAFASGAYKPFVDSRVTPHADENFYATA